MLLITDCNFLAYFFLYMANNNVTIVTL